MGKTAYWFASICACIVVVIGIAMLAVPAVVTILSGLAFMVIGVVILNHMSRQETYILWTRRIGL